ncbi:MAG: phosphate-starvation-inducible PsiE family protein, partial [Vulcanimicrobiaceae bacterium]
TERVMFAVVGILLFVVGFILALRSCADIYYLAVGVHGAPIALTAEFLDIILLILMIAEIGYTVTLSLRGAVLSPMPFLIVGLIAVIRRILVITVQEVQARGTETHVAFVSQSTVDLAILTLVVMAFVIAMRLLSRSPQ